MGLSPQKEALLTKLNDNATNAHQEAAERAKSVGRPIPPAPVPLKPEDLDFPKYLHKDWKPIEGGAKGYLTPKYSELASSPEEAEKLAAKGFSEEPPKGVDFLSIEEKPEEKVSKKAK